MVSPKPTDEGCSRERRRLTPLGHPSSVSALRADPPSLTRGEGVPRRRRLKRSPCPHTGLWCNRFAHSDVQERRAACLSITTVSAALCVPCELACRADRDGPGISPLRFLVCPSWCR
ncbi:hypothetical protein EOD23_08835 [Mesorhizobium sp. USDA-HM6]|nr:hypothetical protein EOD23_08835 [Mesorhizobium sp. USDA-HM6]